MCSENLPSANAETLHNGFPFFCTQLGIGIHGGHQNRCILVVRCLFRRQPVDIDVHISRKCKMVGIINQHDFAGKVTTFSFVYLKVKFPKVEESDLRERFSKRVHVVP